MEIIVDTILGKDEDREIEDLPYLTLDKAIDISKSGDLIKISPGTYNPIQLFSKTKPFEITITGSGFNSICNKFVFDGMFDVTMKDLKIDSITFNTFNSNFKFVNCKFTARNEINLNDSDIPFEGEKESTYISFEDCIFDSNFQMKLEVGKYNIAIKSCEIRHSTIPLIYTRNGELNLKLNMINLEIPILKNSKAYVEIQYTCCNFMCPLYSGNECVTYTKDTIYSLSPQIMTQSQFIIDDDKCKGDNTDEIDIFRAVALDTDKFPQRLIIHKYTNIFRIFGKNPAYLILPLEKDLQNGYRLEIFSEVPFVDINGTKYSKKHILLIWIYGDGWLII